MWMSIVQLEMNLLYSEPSRASTTVFNIFTLFTVLIQCVMYYIVAIVVMQASQSKSVTAAQCFRATLKIAIASIGACCALTLVFGSLLLYNDGKNNAMSSPHRNIATLLFAVQCGGYMVFQISLLCYSYKTCNRLIANLVEFHQFLTSYRQTPRSRIFKKHVPQGVMEPIIEAESFLEQSVAASVLLQNNQSVSNTYRKSMMSTRFVYQEGAQVFEVEVDENDDIESGQSVDLDYFQGSIMLETEQSK